MLNNVTKKDLEKKLVESNIKLIESGLKDTIYRDDSKHLLIQLSYDEYRENPYKEWNQLWNIISEDTTPNFDDVKDVIDELALITGANDEYLWNNLLDKPFIKTKKYIERLGYIVIPVDYNYYASDFINLYLTDYQETLENVHIVAIISKDQLKKEYQTKKVTKNVINHALECLQGQLESQNSYCNGQIYNIRVYDTFENSIVDSLGGVFFSSESNQEVNDIYDVISSYFVCGQNISFDDFKKYYEQNGLWNICLPF